MPMYVSDYGRGCEDMEKCGWINVSMFLFSCACRTKCISTGLKAMVFGYILEIPMWGRGF